MLVIIINAIIFVILSINTFYSVFIRDTVEWMNV